MICYYHCMYVSMYVSMYVCTIIPTSTSMHYVHIYVC